MEVRVLPGRPEGSSDDAMLVILHSLGPELDAFVSQVQSASSSMRLLIQRPGEYEECIGPRSTRLQKVVKPDYTFEFFTRGRSFSHTEAPSGSDEPDIVRKGVSSVMQLCLETLPALGQ